MWGMYVFITLIQGRINNWRKILLVIFPFLFYYLIGGIFEYIYRRRNDYSINKIYLLSIVMIFVDQVIKLAIKFSFQLEEKIPMVEEWLYLYPVKNLYNSGLLSIFQIDIFSNLLIGIGNIIVLIMVMFFYRFYLNNNKRNLWIDSFLLFGISGVGAGIIDTFFWGYTLDYINIPLFLTFDLKDIFINLSVSCLYVEILVINPHDITIKDLLKGSISFFKFIGKDIKKKKFKN